MTELTETALENALRDAMAIACAPRFLIVAPWAVGWLIKDRNRRWKRAAYLARRRG